MRRTSDSLNEGLLITWPDKSFKENDIFSMENIVDSALELSTKKLCSLDKYRLNQRAKWP